MTARSVTVIFCLVALAVISACASPEAETASTDVVPTLPRHSDRWNSERDLFLIDPSDGTPVSLTREIPNNGYPSWSPDETRIAFVSTRDGWCDLYVTHANDDTAQRVTHTETCESWPDWSPAGDRLLYAANPGDFDLWLVDVEAALARGPA